MLCVYIYIYIHFSLSLSLYIYIYTYMYIYIYRERERSATVGRGSCLTCRSIPRSKRPVVDSKRSTQGRFCPKGNCLTSCRSIPRCSAPCGRRGRSNTGPLPYYGGAVSQTAGRFRDVRRPVVGAGAYTGTLALRGTGWERCPCRSILAIRSHALW